MLTGEASGPASILVRYPSGFKRHEILRLAMSAKRALTKIAGLPSRLDVVVSSDASEEPALRVERAADRLVLRVSRSYLLGSPDPARAAADFGGLFEGLERLSQTELVAQPIDTARAEGAKALFFRSLLNSPDKELGADHMYQGVFYIVSALKRLGFPFVLVDGRISLEPGEFVTNRDELDRAFMENPDVNFVGLSLYDDYFEKAAQLIGHIRGKSQGFIAIGGTTATLNPFEVMAHMPEVNFIVRGAGEELTPKILAIIGKATAATGLSESQLQRLRLLEGLLYAQDGVLVLAGVDTIARVADMDLSGLDFSLLEPRHTTSGTVMCISRGCPYHCFFCTSYDKGRFVGKTPAGVARHLAAYGKRLLEIYGRWADVPPQSFGIGFYDDDFLSDRPRAMAIFDVFRKSPFFIQFIQASINSFYLWENGRPTDRLDTALLDSMPEELFKPRFGPAQVRPYIYIGTENYCDDELKRLGKPYGYARVERLVGELGRRKIHQAHHFIVTNAHTTLDHVLKNLVRIIRLRDLSQGYYDVLRPPIANLVSFYASPHYRKMAVDGLLSCVKVRKHLSIAGFGEFDYPLVEKDLALDPDTRDLAEHIQEFAEGCWEETLEKTLLYLIQRSEFLALEAGESERAARIAEVVGRYGDPRALAAAAEPLVVPEPLLV